MDRLIGKTIGAVALSANAYWIRFYTVGGDSYVYECDADCCSESWINHIAGLDALIGHTVAAVEASELPESEPSQRQEWDRVYSYVLVTESGRCSIEMRNASNGYYGGSLTFTSANVETPKIVTEDF